MKPFAYHHDYDRGEQEEAQYEEEPEEPLGIMPKVTAIVFLVSLLNPSALFDLNYFVNRATNAGAESLNSKIKQFRAKLRGVSDVKFFLFRLTKLFA